MAVKILAISGGSKNGTNDQMAKEALMGAQEAGAEVEFIHMLDLNLVPCNGCVSCVTGKDGVFAGGSCRCVRKDDLLWLEPQGRNVTPPALSTRIGKPLAVLGTFTL